MGESFIGLKEIEEFGFELDEKDIPEIPFSEKELYEAKKREGYLILRLDKDKNGDITMKRLISNKTSPMSISCNLTNQTEYDNWWKNSNFYNKEVPMRGWAIVEKNIIPGTRLSMKEKSTRNEPNYLDQIRLSINYLQNETFKNNTMPDKYSEAIEEFQEEEKNIEKIYQEVKRINETYVDNPEESKKGELEYIEKLTNIFTKLKITNLIQRKPIEILYDNLIYNNKFKKFPNENTYLWSDQPKTIDYLGINGMKTRTGFVSMGDFHENGFKISISSPFLGTNNSMLLSRY